MDTLEVQGEALYPQDLVQAALTCRDCVLADGRTRVVFGSGNPNARLILVGEAPGRDEDIQGLPFVGAAGQLLDRILEAAEIPRADVFITNTVLCRPPANRQPLPPEITACQRHLGAKFAWLRPLQVVLLGAVATRTLIDRSASITRLRGQRLIRDGIAFYPTYHPAALLRDPSRKRDAWHDFQRIRDDYRLVLKEGQLPEAWTNAPPLEP